MEEKEQTDRRQVQCELNSGKEEIDISVVSEKTVAELFGTNYSTNKIDCFPEC